jgi:hypothetical protein
MITFGLPHDERVLAAVGRVAIRHGQMDYAHRMLVKTIAGVTVEQALAATERVTSGQLRERIEKLARRRFGDGPTLIRLQAMLANARRLTDRRNELLHSLWAVDEAGQHVLRQEGENWQQIPEPTKLEALADDIINLTIRLNHERLAGFLHEALGEARPADWV